MSNEKADKTEELASTKRRPLPRVFHNERKSLKRNFKMKRAGGCPFDEVVLTV